MTCYRKYCPRVVIFCIFFAPNNYLFNEAKKQIKTNLSPLKISCFFSRNKFFDHFSALLLRRRILISHADQ